MRLTKNGRCAAGVTPGAHSTIGITVDVGTSELRSTVRSGSEFWVTGAMLLLDLAVLVVERMNALAKAASIQSL